MGSLEAGIAVRFIDLSPGLQRRVSERLVEKDAPDVEAEPAPEPEPTLVPEPMAEPNREPATLDDLYKESRSRVGRALWLLPTAEGLAVTTRALREWLGLAVAWALGWLG